MKQKSSLCEGGGCVDAAGRIFQDKRSIPGKGQGVPGGSVQGRVGEGGRQEGAPRGDVLMTADTALAPRKDSLSDDCPRQSCCYDDRPRLPGRLQGSADAPLTHSHREAPADTARTEQGSLTGVR